MKVGGIFGCSHRETVEFRILHGGSRAINRITTLDMRRVNSGFLKDLLGGITWFSALESRGFQENWSLFKYHFLHAQDRCIPLRKKPSKGGITPAWMSKELLENTKWKKHEETHGKKHGKRDRPLGKNIGTLSEYAGMQQGSLRSTWI